MAWLGFEQLLDRLVDGGAVAVAHLVKLVNQADAAVGEHERPALESPLARDRVHVHTRRETDSTGALAGSSQRAGSD